MLENPSRLSKERLHLPSGRGQPNCVAPAVIDPVNRTIVVSVEPMDMSAMEVTVDVSVGATLGNLPTLFDDGNLRTVTVVADATMDGTRDAVTYKQAAVIKVEGGGGVTLTGDGVTDLNLHEGFCGQIVIKAAVA